MDDRQRDTGFTLIEIMIVITIIGVLAGLLLTGISAARKQVRVGEAKTQLDNLKTALAQYNSDTGRYPKDEVDLSGTAKDIADPATTIKAVDPGCTTLVEALDGDGYEDNSTPYFDFKKDHFASDTEFNLLHAAMTMAPSMVDPWGNAWRYRQNYSMGYRYGQSPSHKLRGEDPMAAGIPQDAIMNPFTFDIWSCGPDGLDYDAALTQQNEDNICNWE